MAESAVRQMADPESKSRAAFALRARRGAQWSDGEEGWDEAT
jgi:hypothetical protein